MAAGAAAPLSSLMLHALGSDDLYDRFQNNLQIEPEGAMHQVIGIEFHLLRDGQLVRPLICAQPVKPGYN